ncbi:MAG TPA: Flp pilus assembly protein CpaB [Terriglobales bacterium]|nr:Flp pilus assembly protein CpaB [Terriglobales bacterium]
MKRKRMLGLAVVALAFAALVSLLVYRVARSGGVKAAPAMEAVVAAAGPLSIGQQIQDSDLKLVKLPPSMLPAHIYRSQTALIGHVLTSPAVPNQVIVAEMVAQPGTGVGLPPLIPAGMRAVSVKVNDVVSVAGYAIPGTHVDVLLTGNPHQNGDPADVTTVTLLSDVQVLTAGQQMEQSPNGKPEKVTVITLLVDPAGAQKLALADGYGHIQLALRNPLDKLAEKTNPLINATLYGQRFEASRGVGASRKPAPKTTTPPPLPAEWAVKVISGDKQEVVKFPEHAPRVAGIERSGEHQP